MTDWLLDLVSCAFPDCGGRLTRDDVRGAVLRCRRCEAPYPILGDVPILVSDPARYLAEHHDAVLATLAEKGLATHDSMRVLADFASQAAHPEPRTFGDDWVPGEEGSLPARATAATETEASRAFASFLEIARDEPLEDRLAEMLGGRGGTIVEVGPGAGTLSARLARRAQRLVLADWSFRAVLRASRSARAGGTTGAAEIAGLVCDAEQLPLRAGKARAIVAANVIDLLDQPGAFLGGAAHALSRSGKLLLSTPAPELGLSTGEPILSELVAAAGLHVREVRDGLPWIRAHGPRHFQVYFVQAILAERR